MAQKLPYGTARHVVGPQQLQMLSCANHSLANTSMKAANISFSSCLKKQQHSIGCRSKLLTGSESASRLINLYPRFMTTTRNATPTTGPLTSGDGEDVGDETEHLGEEEYHDELDYFDEEEIEQIEASLKNMEWKIKQAEFITSSVKYSQCPRDTKPEFAVIGRSNVGKSSLINMLTNNGKLAKISKTPGKTQTINHFLINKKWYFVDLPGYGYAKVSKVQRMEFFGFTKEYFLKREQLVHVMLLVDASIPPTSADKEVLVWLKEAEVPISIVFTKTDKKKKKLPKPVENMTAFVEYADSVYADSDDPPVAIATSSKNKKGRDDVLKYLASIRASLA